MDAFLFFLSIFKCCPSAPSVGPDVHAAQGDIISKIGLANLRQSDSATADVNELDIFDPFRRTSLPDLQI